MTIRLVLVSLLVCYFAPAIRADSPLPPPKRHEVESPSKKYVATIDPTRGVSLRAAGSRKTLWKSPKVWSRTAFLADDGEHFVTGHSELIPREYTTNLVLITFWHKDKKIRDLTLGEIIPNTNVLVRTASHFRWGGIHGITDGKLTVKPCDNQEVKYDIATGKVSK